MSQVFDINQKEIEQTSEIFGLAEKDSSQFSNLKADKFVREKAYDNQKFYKHRHIKSYDIYEQKHPKKLQIQYLKELPLNRKNQIKEFLNRKEKQEKDFRKQLEFQMDRDTSAMPFIPGLWFIHLFSQQTANEKIKIRIPESFINGFGFPTGGIAYTSPDGFLKFQGELAQIQKEDYINKISKQKIKLGEHLAPALILRLDKSEFNKVIMPDDSEGNDRMVSLENLPPDAVLQRYILSKGKLTGKVRIH